MNFFLENMNWILSGIGLPIIGFILKCVYQFLKTHFFKKPVPDRDIVDEFFSHTERLIQNKLWSDNPSFEYDDSTNKSIRIDDINSFHVPLSAQVISNERIPQLFKDLESGDRIENLNKFIRSSKKQRTLLAITGGPGSGKTFELVKLFYDFKKEYSYYHDWFPILIFINELSADSFKNINPNDSLRMFFVEYLKTTGYLDDVVSYLIKHFFNLNIIFLFDALDEIPQKSQYEQAIKVISEDFIRESKNNKKTDWRFLLTCRTEDYDTKIPLDQINIEPLSSKQIELFFKKNKNLNMHSRWRKAWKRVNLPDMNWFEPFKSNPYFLTLMIARIKDTIETRGDIPFDISELFKKTIERELFKSVKGGKYAFDLSEVQPEFRETFEFFCSIVAFFLIEKKENAVFNPYSPKDISIFLKVCKVIKSRTHEPFKSIINYIEYLEGYPNKNLTNSNLLSSEFVPYLNYEKFQKKILKIIGELVKDHTKDKYKDELKKLSRTLFIDKNLKDFDDLEDVSNKVLSKIFDFTNNKQDSIFYFVCFLIFLFIINIGIKKQVFRVDQTERYVIKGFRHRRIMEYLAALFIDTIKFDFRRNANNLWYKQTLCILAAISTDIQWFFRTLNHEDKDSLFTLVDACQFIHPRQANKSKDFFLLIINRLKDQISKSDSPMISYHSLSGMHKMIMAGHWEPDISFTEQLIEMSKDISMFRICLNILLELDKKNKLNKALYFYFVTSCLRNIISLKSI